MSITFEDGDVRAFVRVLSKLFDIQIHQDVVAAQSQTAALIQQLQQQVQAMSDKLQSGLDTLKADVAAQATVIASATTAFQGLAQQLADALAAAKAAGATDAQLAELTALQQGVESNTQALSAAIPQNTPAAGGEQPVTGGGAGNTQPAPGTPIDVGAPSEP